MIVQEERYLEHFGVLGMHWGVRKDKDSSGKSYRGNKPGIDRSTWVKGGILAAALASLAGGLTIAKANHDYADSILNGEHNVHQWMIDHDQPILVKMRTTGNRWLTPGMARQVAETERLQREFGKNTTRDVMRRLNIHI